MSGYTIADIASHIGAQLSGDGQSTVTGMAPLQTAMQTQMSFLDNPRYRCYLANTQACAVILTAESAADCPVATLIVDNPYVAYAKAATLFAKQYDTAQGIHASAVIDAAANVADNVTIGANSIIGPNAIIEKNVIIGAGCVIAEGVHIGENTRLSANVTLYHDVHIGARCILHSGVVVGSDGFGMAKEGGKWLKVPQLGSVRIGDDVEIGANTVIDRGALDDTVIGNDVKLDNLVQVAHNVQIGEHTAIAGCTAIAGSTTIGKHCLIGGGVCINGHIQIADNIALAGMASVVRSITTPGVYASGLEIQPIAKAKRNAVRFKKLDEMAQRLANLEKQLASKVDEHQ